MPAKQLEAFLEQRNLYYVYFWANQKFKCVAISRLFICITLKKAIY